MTEQETQSVPVNVDDSIPSPEAAPESEQPTVPEKREPPSHPSTNATVADGPSPGDSPEETTPDGLTADATAKTHAGKKAEPVNVIAPRKVVRRLAVGMETDGVVKRITKFGAFVDIGVGRDGLVHISQVSVKRINRIEDVLKVGDEVRVWVKELDRARNRISLTMISPDTKTIQDLREGEVVTGIVTRILPYGAFVDIGVEREGMLHIREMSEGFVAKPEDVVKANGSVEVRIQQIDKSRGRIDLSMKGLRPEEEQHTRRGPAVKEPVVEAPEEEEPPTVVELAFEKARRAQRIDKGRSKRRERQKRDDNQSRLDDIIERTLQQHQTDED